MQNQQRLSGERRHFAVNLSNMPVKNPHMMAQARAPQSDTQRQIAQAIAAQVNAEYKPKVVGVQVIFGTAQLKKV